MPVLQVVLVLVAVGVLVAIVTKFIPDDYLDPRWKKLIFYVAMIGSILWLLSLFGLFAWLSAIKIGSQP